MIHNVFDKYYTYTCVRYWKWLLFLRPPPPSRDDTFQRCSDSDHYRDCYWVFFDVRTLRLFFHITAHQAKRPVVGQRAILYVWIYIDMRSDSSFCLVSAHVHTWTRMYVCMNNKYHANSLRTVSRSPSKHPTDEHVDHTNGGIQSSKYRLSPFGITTHIHDGICWDTLTWKEYF